MASVFAAVADMQRTGIRASFHGASHGRLYRDWTPSALHPDLETRYSLRELRARARDLVRNNPYAAGIVDAFADNIIGWDGIQLQSAVLDPLTAKPNRDVNWLIEDRWKEWDAPEHASLDGEESWLEIQRTIAKTWVVDGECFVRERRGADNAFGYAVEILDADLLDETFNLPQDKNGVEIRMGVELDRHGRRLAYHFFRRHPSEGSRERVRIPASEIIHFYTRYRTGQTRGFSMFAPVLTTIRMIDGLTEAELTAARAEASKMGFILNSGDEAAALYAERLRIMQQQGVSVAPRAVETAPGMVDELAPGQTFAVYDPSHPNSAFEPFLKIMMLGVARAFSMSYLTVTGDVSAANYSSMRAGLIPERDHWRILQTVMAKRVHRRVHRSWLAMAMLSGALRLPTPFASDYYAASWKPRGWKWVDPVKDLLAGEMAIALGVDSRQRIAAEGGRDFEEVVDELAEEQEYAAAEGVYVGGSKGRSGSQEQRNNNSDNRDASTPGNRVAALLNGANGNGKH